MAKQFTLGKNERLKSRKSIEQLFSEGKKLVVSPFRVHYLTGEFVHFPLQFGTGVSTKNFKKATDRNRVKRIVREAYRLQKRELQEKLNAKRMQLHIFFIYTGKELPVYRELYSKMKIILDKLSKIVDALT